MCLCKGKCSLKNYVLFGRGIGLKVIVLFTFLISLFMSITVGVTFTKLVNEQDFQSFIKELPVVKIENGKIVEPVYDNMLWIIPGTEPNGAGDVVIVANTTVDEADRIPEEVTVYISARHVYVRNDDGTMDRYSIPANTTKVITPDVVTKVIKSAIWGFSALIALVLWGVSILIFLVTYLVVMLLGFIANRQLTIDAWGRLLAYPWCVVWLLSLILNFYGIPVTMTVTLLTAILVTLVGGALLPHQATAVVVDNDEITDNDGISATSEKEEPIVSEAVIEDTVAVPAKSEKEEIKQSAKKQPIAKKSSKKETAGVSRRTVKTKPVTKRTTGKTVRKTK